jgi:hypothetical protein
VKKVYETKNETTYGERERDAEGKIALNLSTRGKPRTRKNKRARS